MNKRLIGSILVFCLILVNLLVSEELRPYKLINSDKLLVEKGELEYITLLIGNVHFFYGDTEFFSDQAEIYEKQKLTKMIGNVEVLDDTLFLSADIIEYHRNEDELNLTGNVKIVETHIDSTKRYYQADSVGYLRTDKTILADNNVIVFDERENLRGECGQLRYYMQDKYGYLIKEPAIFMLDKDSVSVAAQKIEYFQDFRKIAASFDIKVLAKEFSINSDFLLYFEEDDKAIFLGNPEFNSDFANARAREFQLFFDDRNLIQADLYDSCRVDFRTEDNTDKKSWAEANYMRFDFDNGELEKCNAINNVISYFHQDKTQDRDFSANHVNGQQLVIEVEDNKITLIRMEKRIQGKYKFSSK